MNAILVGMRCSECPWVYGYRPPTPQDFAYGRFRPEQAVRYCPRCEGATVAVQWALAADVPVVTVVGRKA